MILQAWIIHPDHPLWHGFVGSQLPGPFNHLKSWRIFSLPIDFHRIFGFKDRKSVEKRAEFLFSGLNMLNSSAPLNNHSIPIGSIYGVFSYIYHHFYSKRAGINIPYTDGMAIPRTPTLLWYLPPNSVNGYHEFLPRYHVCLTKSQQGTVTGMVKKKPN